MSAVFVTRRDMMPAAEEIGEDLAAGESAEFDDLALTEQERARALCFGEAIFAISEALGPDILSPRDPRLLSILERAYRDMTAGRLDFSAQDFALYAMSLLVDEMEEESILQLQRGASQYLLDVNAELASDFRVLAPDARAYLRSTLIRPERQEERPAAPEAPAEAAPREAERKTRRQKHPYRREHLRVADRSEGLPEADTPRSVARPSRVRRHHRRRRGRNLGLAGFALLSGLGLLVIGLI